MNESSLQSLFIKKIKQAGGLAVKVDCSSRRGWPDLIVVIDGITRLVEMKTETGKLSMHQRCLHDELLSLGASVSVIDSPEAIDTWIRDYHYDPY